MLKNYFKIAWRNIIRHKIYTLINVLGLSLGLSVCIVIYLVTNYELSFDTFHSGKERIYRIMGDVTESTGDQLTFARVPPALTLQGRSELSGLESIASIIPYNAKIKIHNKNQAAKHFEGYIAGTHYSTTVITEPQYFDIFKYNWLAGNPETAFAAPYSVVLTESRARQYFGNLSAREIIGKQITYEDSLQVQVSGVIKDWNKNTDLLFTDFISFSTLQNSFLKNRINTHSWGQGDMSAWTFAKLSTGVAPEQVNAEMKTLVKIHAGALVRLTLWLEPLSDIHFNADIIENPIRTAHRPTLYGLMGIALFILILAVINFINLSTAQSIQRAREVGIRKVLGSSRLNLIFQFLMETFLITFFAVLLAISFVEPILSAFQSFIPSGVILQLFKPAMILFLIAITLITTIFSGLYPAKILSSYLPILNLKGGNAQKGGEKWLLRKGLIIFQFSISLIFIISSIILANQLHYTREKDLGFSTDAILTLDTPRGEGYAKVALLAQQIKQITGIDKVALQWLPPMTDNARGMKLKYKATDEKDFWVTQVAGNEDFIPLYDIKLLAGRNLLKSDSVTEFVINESFSQYMGYKKPEEALNKILYWNDKPYPVVGIVADFHTSSLHDPITPLCIINRPDRESSIAIKLATTGQQSSIIKTTLSSIEKVWKQIYPASSFNYKFYDESLALLYIKDQQTATLLNTAMLMTIFLSCIGLFGLTLFTAEKRAKEISIRKIFGASIKHIIILLSGDFIILVIIALVIASPIAWYLMNEWLQDFAYRIKIQWWFFALGGLGAIGVALLTLSFQAIRAAVANPVESLKNE